MVNSLNSNQINNQIALNQMQQLQNAKQNFNATRPENKAISTKVEDAKKSPLTSISLFLASWFGLSKAADYFNVKCGGEYSKSLIGKIGNFGDKVSESSFGKAVGSVLNKPINSLKNYWKLHNESNPILRMFKNPASREFAFAKSGAMKGYIDEVSMDVIDVMRGFQNEHGAQTFAKAFGHPYEYFDKMNSGASTHAKELEKGLKDALSYCKKHGISDKSLLNDAPMLQAFSQKQIRLPKILSRNARLSESLNKLHGAKGLANPMQKSTLGKLLPKWTLKLMEGLSNGTAGGKIVIAMQAGMLAEAIYKTYKAPWGEKKAAFFDTLSNDIAMYMMMPLYAMTFNYVGGTKYFNMTTAQKQAYQTALKAFNEKAATGLMTKAEYKAGKKAVKALANAGGKWWTKPIRLIGKISDFGCERIFPHIQQGHTFTNGLKRFGHFLKGCGGWARLFIGALVLSPMFAKPVVKLSHKIFGRPTNSVLDDDKKDTKTAQKTARTLNNENIFAPINGSDKNAIGLTTKEMALLKQKGLSDEDILQVAVYKKQMEEQQKRIQQRKDDLAKAKPLESRSLLNKKVAAERLQGAKMSSSAPRTYIPSSDSKVKPQKVTIPENVAKAFTRADIAEQDAMSVLKG